MTRHENIRLGATAGGSIAGFDTAETIARSDICSKDEIFSTTLSEVACALTVIRCLARRSVGEGSALGRCDMLAVTRGCGLLVQGDRTLDVRSGDVVLLGEGSATRLALAQCTALHATIDTSSMSLAFNMPAEGSLLVRGSSLEGRIATFLLSTIQEASGPEVAGRRVLAALEVATTLCRLGRTSRNTDDHSLAERLRAAVDSAAGQRPFDPAGIAAAVGISRSTLYRMTERFGGVEAFMRTRRLDLSMGAILDATHVSEGIKSIALQHGFATAAHFSRSFRARFAMSASDARKLAARSLRPEILSATDHAAAMQLVSRALLTP